MRSNFNKLVILGLGSNLPWSTLDCISILDEAVAALGKILIEIKRASLYESEPLLVKDQNPFLNTAVSGIYSGSPEELLDKIHQIEAQFGRDRARERRWGERSLDIDILLFGDRSVSTPSLHIPHLRLEERRFALEPLLELSPKAYSPITGIPYREICDKLPEQGVTRRDLPHLMK